MKNNWEERFNTFKQKTYEVIDSHKHPDLGYSIKYIDIPYGICDENNRLKNFIKELENQNYTVILAKQNYAPVPKALFISWTSEGWRKIKRICFSEGTTVYQ